MEYYSLGYKIHGIGMARSCAILFLIFVRNLHIVFIIVATFILSLMVYNVSNFSISLPVREPNPCYFFGGEEIIAIIGKPFPR